MRARAAVALAVVALGAGYAVGREPEPRENGPGAALRAYQRARIDALGECAKFGFATQWGDVAPDSRIDLECRSLSPHICTAYPVPNPPEDEEPALGTEL